MPRGAALPASTTGPSILAFSFFRLAAICQGVYKRALDGNASNPEKARRYGEAVRCSLGTAVPADRSEGLWKMSSRFEGLTVLITGATGGFGRRAAERFAADGARLVLSDLDAEALAALAATLPAETASLAGDISDEALSEDLVALAVARFGRLDIAINNAGIAQSFVRLPQRAVR